MTALPATSRRAGPVDPRLLHGRAVRVAMAGDVVAAVLGALLWIAQAVLLARVIVAGADGAPPAALLPDVLALGAVVAGRGMVVAARGVLDQRAATTARTRLRDHGFRAVLDGGRDRPAGAVATALTSGLDALDGWFRDYLPALLEALVVPPILLVFVLGRDPWSALLLGVTLPLAPIFLALVGMDARDRAQAQWRALQALGAHLLEVVRGLPTLRILGRAEEQVAALHGVADDLRDRTMRVLRVAFLSALVLELVAMLGTALVAVVIGLRLVAGELDLATGLAVLIVAPEVYLPLRRLGAAYHASQDGTAAAAEVLDGIAAPTPAETPAPPGFDAAAGDVVLRGVTVRRPGRRGAVLADVDMAVPAGGLTVITGPSGAGKSTILDVLLGRVHPEAGRVEVDGVPFDPASRAWRDQVAWAPQRPALGGRTLLDAVRLAAPDADPTVVAAVAAETGFDAVAAAAPQGWATAVDPAVRPLSGGERRRLGLTRALVRQAVAGAPVLIVDEPTADLDERAAARVRDALTRPGTTRVVASHDPVMAELADHVVVLDVDGRARPAVSA